jgi:putative transposase
VNNLWLSKPCEIKIKLYCDIDSEIQRIRIKKKPTGKLFVSLLVKWQSTSNIQTKYLSVVVGVGIKSFVTLSSCQYIQNPKFFVIYEKVLAKAQKKWVKAPKGMGIRANALKIVEHINESISNKREDFRQKVSLNLVRTYELMTFEDLNVKEMTKNHCLAKHIADASWCKLIPIVT